MSASDPLLGAWQGYLASCQAMLDRLRPDAAGTQPPSSPPFVEVWQDLAKSFGISSGFFADASRSAEMPPTLPPAMGVTREYQLIGQRMLTLSLQFQRQYAEFTKLTAEVQQSALQSFSSNKASTATFPTDPAAAYDAWIEGAEQAYAQLAHSNQFAQSLGEMVNTLSQFKAERGKLQEIIARALDVPSRAEVDTLHRQVRELTLALRAAAADPATVGSEGSARGKSRQP